MLLVLLVTWGCHCRREVEETGAPLPEAYNPPDIPGPWFAGFDLLELTGPDGEGLEVWLWSPAVEPGAQPADYAPLGEGEATTDAVPDCAEPRPVAVMSHASGGLPGQSWFLAERLATHGWVVAAPAHPGSTRDDLDLTELVSGILRRPGELAATFDGLVALSATEGDPLYGCVDPAAGYAAVGHDLGGSTALLAAGATIRGVALSPLCDKGDSVACGLIDEGLGGDLEGELSLADPRVFAVFALAPTDLALDAGGLDDVSAPVGILGASLDASVSWDEVLAPTFDALPVSPKGLGGIEGAGHLSLTALCPVYVGWPECEEGGGYLTPERTWAAINVTAVPVLEVLRGEDRAGNYLPPEREDVSWGWE